MQAKPPQKNLRPQDYVTALLGWLLFPALMGAVFTRGHFGLRMVGSPGRWVLGTLVFWIFHDIGTSQGHWHNPPFFQSVAWRYFEVMYGLAAWHAFHAWRAFRRRDSRHTYSMGEPWIMRLGIPYRVACLLDAAMVFLVGCLVRDYVDVALGLWLIVGGFGLALLAVMGAQQQFRDTADLMDAGYYAGNIQDQVERPAASPQPSYAQGRDDEEELSTSAQGRRQ